mmetsp:Transcript_6038/g.14582  ORF Transcript_6038/g.14582 Transcript_6038/m.14582 type:complete len:243 (+) Transcript_6038:1216-1944(+)
MNPDASKDSNWQAHWKKQHEVEIAEPAKLIVIPQNCGLEFRRPAQLNHRRPENDGQRGRRHSNNRPSNGEMPHAKVRKLRGQPWVTFRIKGASNKLQSKILLKDPVAYRRAQSIREGEGQNQFPVMRHKWYQASEDEGVRAPPHRQNRSVFQEGALDGVRLVFIPRSNQPAGCEQGCQHPSRRPDQPDSHDERRHRLHHRLHRLRRIRERPFALGVTANIACGGFRLAGLGAQPAQPKPCWC